MQKLRQLPHRALQRSFFSARGGEKCRHSSGSPLPKFVIYQVSVPSSEKVMNIQESVARAMRTFQRFKNVNENAAQTRQQHLHFQLSTANCGSSSENTAQSTPFAARASFPRSFISSSCSAFLRRSSLPRSQITALVLEVLRDD